MIQSGRVQGKAPEPIPAPSAEGPWVVAKGDAGEEKHVEAFKSSWPAIWPKKDRKAYEALLTDDFVQDDVAWGMTFKGKTEAGKGMDGFVKAVPDLTVTVDSAWGFGDVVVAELTMKGTHKGPLGSVKATNKPFTAHVVNVVEHRDGKQARSAIYMTARRCSASLVSSRSRTRRRIPRSRTRRSPSRRSRLRIARSISGQGPLRSTAHARSSGEPRMP